MVFNYFKKKKQERAFKEDMASLYRNLKEHTSSFEDEAMSTDYIDNEVFRYVRSNLNTNLRMFLFNQYNQSRSFEENENSLQDEYKDNMRYLRKERDNFENWKRGYEDSKESMKEFMKSPSQFFVKTSLFDGYEEYCYGTGFECGRTFFYCNMMTSRSESMKRRCINQCEYSVRPMTEDDFNNFIKDFKNYCHYLPSEREANVKIFEEEFKKNCMQ